MIGIDLEDVPLLCVVGAGGVGKTTVAAALAVRAAHEGRRVLLLTVDPARRLASALGVALSDAAREVPLPGGASSTGHLRAAMLESGASFDALVARVVVDPAARAAILRSPTYQGFSRTLARSHAYAALERLHALALGDEHAGVELVVLDTPPGAAALDLLDAPAALARFAEDRVVTALTGGGGTALLFGVRALLGATAGATVARELSEFLGAFLPARRGFAERAHQIEELVRRRARRVLVVAPDRAHLREASALHVALAARDLGPHGAIANRAFFRSSPRWALADAHRLLAPSPAEARALEAAHALGLRERSTDEERRLRLAEFERTAGVPITRTLPFQSEEPTSVEALLELVR